MPHCCTGCNHCLACLPCALTYELCDATRRNHVFEAYQPWWPASIDSPTLYFHLKRRAMEHQIREQARAAPFSDPAVWRAAHTSATAGVSNPLLSSRGQRQLGLRLPTARTNLTASEAVELVGITRLHTPQPAAPPAVAPQQQQQQQVAASPAHLHKQQHQQQQRQQQLLPIHKVVRPRPRRPVPLHPGCPVAAPLPQQQQHQEQQQMGLLASLHYQEQCHMQQLAATGAPAPHWGAGTGFVAVEAAHPAAWQCPAWQAGSEHQQQQAQAHYHPHQQQQHVATAVAPSWPYTIPQPQRGSWVHAGSLAPLHHALAATAVA